MNESDWLAERFEAHRSHLRAVAYRMLGSLSEADDAVQEAWIRLSRSDTSGSSESPDRGGVHVRAEQPPRSRDDVGVVALRLTGLSI